MRFSASATSSCCTGGGAELRATIADETLRDQVRRPAAVGRALGRAEASATASPRRTWCSATDALPPPHLRAARGPLRARRRPRRPGRAQADHRVLRRRGVRGRGARSLAGSHDGAGRRPRAHRGRVARARSGDQARRLRPARPRRPQLRLHPPRSGGDRGRAARDHPAALDHRRAGVGRGSRAPQRRPHRLVEARPRRDPRLPSRWPRATRAASKACRG